MNPVRQLGVIYPERLRTARNVTTPVRQLGVVNYPERLRTGGNDVTGCTLKTYTPAGKDRSRFKLDR